VHNSDFVPQFLRQHVVQFRAVFMHLHHRTVAVPRMNSIKPVLIATGTPDDAQVHRGNRYSLRGHWRKPRPHAL